MAKRVRQSTEEETNTSHFKPQTEPTGWPARPDAVDAAHLKPQAEAETDAKRPKAVDPKHLKPQE